MRILVVPDIHLKPYIFERASQLMKSEKADMAVCLMDIADDWGQETNIGLYEESYDAAIAFAEMFPDTLWCYGNHDVCYLWDERESGYSALASVTVCNKLERLRNVMSNSNKLAFVHRIDNVLFSHGGLLESYVRDYVSGADHDDIDVVIRTINEYGRNKLWNNASPIWCRPQFLNKPMYKEKEMLQVLGHTPVERLTRHKNLISCDTFSTYRDGTPIGTQEYLLLDTVSWAFYGIK